MATVMPQARYVRIGIVDVAKDNRPGRARCLAGRDHITLSKRPILLIGRSVRGFDPLRAIGAFLHHPARANGDIGILRGMLRRLRRGPIVVEIEAPYLVGTEAGA